MESILTPAVFVLSYVLFVAFPRSRHWVAAVGATAVLLLSLGGLGIDPRAAFLGTTTAEGVRTESAVNWSVMGIFLGTLVVAELFMRSGMPAHLADLVIRRSPSARFAMLAICLITGGISIFVENVAAVLILAPVALAMTERLGIRPVKLFIAMAVSSNLQGCATLIGDPPSMLLGAASGMTFNDFFWFHGRPSMFFVVQFGALASFVVLFLAMREHRQPVEAVPIEPVRSVVPTVFVVLLVLGLAVGSIFDPHFKYGGVICMALAVLALAWDAIVHRTDAWKLVRELDWSTTLFLLCVFILVGALQQQGVLVWLADVIHRITGDNLLVAFLVLVGISMAVSAFVDNVPFLVAMIPVTMELNRSFNYSTDGHESFLLLFGLLIGASLGGNISPIGASANIVAMSIVQKRGHETRFREFVAIGLPFTLLATAAGCLFLWFVWR
jgi:Na+/H+ antiporter NhaD/arsenite permease-like protein